MLSGSSRSFWRFVVAVLVVGPLPAALAQTPGSLDTSFGGVGFVSTAVSTGAGDDRARAMMLQPDGRIVVAGACDNNFCLVRYHTDGTLDSSFGIGGRVNETRASTTLTAYSAALQPDGKIVVVGNCIVGLTATMCAARFMADGSLDSAFGTSAGWTLPNVTSGGDVAKAVALQTDGKIVLAGVCTGFASPTAADFCLVRLSANGTLDTTFDTDGKVTTTIGTGTDRIHDMLLQPDGKILVGGYSNNGSNDDVALVRLNSNGTLDATFGIVTMAFGNDLDRCWSMTLQPDGKILLGCQTATGVLDDFALARFNSNGTLDTTFGTGGKVVSSLSSLDDIAYAIQLLPDGKILLGGLADRKSVV